MRIVKASEEIEMERWKVMAEKMMARCTSLDAHGRYADNRQKEHMMARAAPRRRSRKAAREGKRVARARALQKKREKETDRQKQSPST